jgi:hypothetical protein
MVDDDGLPLDEVGAWAKEKHTRLRKYVDISSATRRKWTQGPGGATYIDLFCGSGRSIIRDTQEKIDGSRRCSIWLHARIAVPTFAKPQNAKKVTELFS